MIGSGLNAVDFPAILLEDERLAAVDKPAGLGVAALLRMARERLGASAAFVHRFDPEASGVVLIARDKQALDFVGGQFQSKSARLVHHALVALAGPPLAPSFSVDAAIGPDESGAARVQVFARRAGGEPAHSEFRVAEAFGRFAWVECVAPTGRRHQLRVHLASAGAPVLGDALYGASGAGLLLSGLKKHYKGRAAEKPLVRRLALHAGSLRFQHPAGRAEAMVSAPVPDDLSIALKYLRKFGGGA